MPYTNVIRTSVVFLFILLIVTWAQALDAQGRSSREGGRPLNEEDLDDDSRAVTPDTESVDDETDEANGEPFRQGEEEFSNHGVRTVPPPPSEDEALSSTPDSSVSQSDDSVEEPQVMTSGPPPLPAQNSLLPREQVAVSVIAAGVAAMEKEDVIQARMLFERAIEIAPLQPYSYFFLGRLALTRGEHQKALPLLRKAEVLLTRGDQAWRSEAMSAQGAVYEDLGEIPQARRAYRKSLRLFPQNLRAMSALARLAGEEPDSDDPVPQ